MPMLPTLDGPSPTSPTHPSYPNGPSHPPSALSRLANLVVLNKHHSAASHARNSSSGEQSTSYLTQSQGHSRTQSDESDWYAPQQTQRYSTLPRTARGHESSSGEEREREMGDARGRRRESTGVRSMGGHPYAAAGAMVQAGYTGYLQPAPPSPVFGPPTQQSSGGAPPRRQPQQQQHQPTTPIYLPPPQHLSQPPQQQQQQRHPPSFAAHDPHDPSIAESPPRPLQPSKSASAVARFRAAAAKHAVPLPPPSSSASAAAAQPMPYYSTLPASTMSVLEGTREVESRGMPLTPPGAGGGEGGGEWGYATVYPPVRVSLPLSPPRESMLSSVGGGGGGGHPYAPYATGQPSTRRVRSSNSLLSSFTAQAPSAPSAPPTQPLSPTRPTPQHFFTPPSFPSHPFAPSHPPSSYPAQPPQRSQPAPPLSSALAFTQLDVPPFRVPQQAHPYAHPTLGRDRSQTVGVVPTHWRHQGLRGSTSAYDLRPTPPAPTTTPAAAAAPQAQAQPRPFPRLTQSRSHAHLPSAPLPSPPAKHPHHPHGHGEKKSTESGGSGHQTLQVMTACDALVFPRPRLRPHAISPPESPGESPLFPSSNWTRQPAQPQQPQQPQPPQPSPYLQRVIEEGVQRDRERVEWAAAAERGLFVRRRAKSVPRSRRGGVPRSSRGGVSEDEGTGVGSWWSYSQGKQSGEGGEKVGGLERGGSTGSRVLRKPSRGGTGRGRAESTPEPAAAVGVLGQNRRAEEVGVGRNESLRERAMQVREEEKPRLTRRERRRREEENIPVIDIRPPPPPEPRRSLDSSPAPPLTRLPSRPRARTSPPRATPPPPPPSLQPPDHAHTVHSSLPPSPTPPIGVALSTPPATMMVHPHIPHPYANAMGAASSSELLLVSKAPAPGLGQLMAGPHPSTAAGGGVEGVEEGDIARRHRMPPRAGPVHAPATHHHHHHHHHQQQQTQPQHPYATAEAVPSGNGGGGGASGRQRVPRKPVPSYPPAVPPILASALESSDSGRQFMASVNADADPVSREPTPKPRQPAERRRGHHLWDLETERALLIAAGLNPSPSPGAAGEDEEKRFSRVVGQRLEAPLDEGVLRLPTPRVSEGETTEPESGGFVTAPETPFGVSREELGDMGGGAATPPMMTLSGSMYLHGSARSGHTIASSNVLPLARTESIPLTPRLPSSPGSPASPYSAQRPASKRTMSAGSRESSPQVEPPPPLGGLDQIEAQMFKDLWTPQVEDVDQAQLDRDMEEELNEARKARAEARREREREMALRVEVVDEEELEAALGEEEDGDPQLPKFASRMPGGPRLEPQSKNTSRRPSSSSRSEAVETPVSAYSEDPEDDVRMRQVDMAQVPQPTLARIRHLSVPLSILDSDSTEIASNDPLSPPPARAISLSPSEAQQLSLPSSAFQSDFAHRHSHMTGLSMVTSNTSGNERMSGLLSDFPQPPEDTAVTPSSVHQSSSYYTPASELDDYPVQLRLDESPMGPVQSLQHSEAEDSPTSREELRLRRETRGQN